MNKFEMPSIGLVHFSADDIISTSGAAATSFTYGNEPTTVNISKDLTKDSILQTRWSDFINSTTPVNMGA